MFRPSRRDQRHAGRLCVKPVVWCNCHRSCATTCPKFLGNADAQAKLSLGDGAGQRPRLWPHLRDWIGSRWGGIQLWVHGGLYGLPEYEYESVHCPVCSKQLRPRNLCCRNNGMGVTKNRPTSNGIQDPRPTVRTCRYRASGPLFWAQPEAHSRLPYAPESVSYRSHRTVATFSLIPQLP